MVCKRKLTNNERLVVGRKMPRFCKMNECIHTDHSVSSVRFNRSEEKKAKPNKQKNKNKNDSEKNNRHISKTYSITLAHVGTLPPRRQTIKVIN